MVSPYNYLQPDYRPNTNSVLLNGASFSDTELGSQNIGVDEFTSNSIFYPNPVYDVVNLPTDGIIMDLNGRFVMNVKKGENFLTSLVDGVYIYQNKLGFNTKLIKK